jgi:predicted transcriptional regulator
MVIRLSSTLQKRVEREAKARGAKPAKLFEDALREYLASKRKPRNQVSEARQQLRELLKHKKKVDDFDAAVHAANDAPER